MPRNVTLAKLIEETRAEIGASTNVGQGIGSVPSLEQTIRRNQERLYQEYSWPHLIIDRDESLVMHGRYYTFSSDLNFERLLGAWVKYSDTWRPLEYGFDPMVYNTQDTENGEYDDPVRRWRHYEGNQYEVWPVPTANNLQKIRFRGLKKLSPLLSGTDTCDLDSTLIVLFSAAEILTRLKAADAENKLSVANQHYRTIRANFDKTQPFIMGGGVATTRPSGPIYGARI